jgi:DNA-binding NarL/FixJ family response regulator
MLNNGHIDPPRVPTRVPQPILSPRECEVLELLAEGATNRDAAKHLFLSEETVKSHVRSAMLKLHARTRTHAVVLALREGLIDKSSQAA